MISRKNSHYQASEESSKILEAVGISYDEDKSSNASKKAQKSPVSSLR